MLWLAGDVWRKTEDKDTGALSFSNTFTNLETLWLYTVIRLLVCRYVAGLHSSPRILYSLEVLAPAGKWAKLALKYKFGAEIHYICRGEAAKMVT